DSQPQRVLLGQPNRTLGLLLDLATARGSIADPGGRFAHRVAGPGRGPDHGLLGSGGGVAGLVLEVVHRLPHLVLGPRGPIGLVADGLHGLAHLGSGVLYVLSDLVWVLAHWTSSFNVSMVCSGTGGVARFMLAWPCLTRTKAMIPYPPATIRAASQAGMTASRARMKQVVRAAAASSPMAPAAPNSPTPAPAWRPFWVSSALASSSSWWTSRVVCSESCLSSSPIDRSPRSLSPGPLGRWVTFPTSERRVEVAAAVDVVA